MGRDVSYHSKSPVSRHSSRHKESPSRRERSPAPRHRSSHRSISPEREKHSGHARSPSPRTKRLRRAQTEREPEKGSEREHDRSHGREHDREVGDRRKERRLERDDNGSRSDREVGDRRKERRLERDDNGNRSSRSRHGRSSSPPERDYKKHQKSRSPRPAADSKSRDEVRSSNGAENRDDEDDAVAKMKAAEDALEAKQKHKPSFELSGKLAEETNRVRGVTLLFSEPSEARKPDIRWRLYVFKGGEVLNEPLYIHRQSCYLFGRERRVADIPTDHPSCSKQHAVIQFRQVEKEQPDGMLKKQVKPYLMDLGSTNKTLLNDNPIEPQRYYELFERDTIKFGNSSREYVLLHENSVT